MSIKGNYNHTLKACYVGYITQAIVNNFVPLLFLTFQSTYAISLDKITMLVTVNFLVQLIVDLLATKLIDKIGYRVSIVAAHIFAAAGLVGLAFLPTVLPDPFIGLLLSVIIYAVGGGIIEVLISPIVEACPTERKEAAMSLLHSFYCWGQVFVVLFSTVFFLVIGIDNWPVLAIIWAIIPFLNAIFFMRVPIAKLINEGETGMSMRQIFSMKIFWVFVVLMVCAGASELAMSQWASAFAEAGLGVSKTIGDLMGPCLFAVLMGTARVLFAKLSERINLIAFMAGSGVLCIASYLLAALAPVPALGLAGCALCGFSVGILWPGTFSLASAKCPRGGTALFALLALAGDLGCSGGPTVVGLVSDAFGGNIKSGLLVALIFPVVLILFLWITKKMNGQKAAKAAENK